VKKIDLRELAYPERVKWARLVSPVAFKSHFLFIQFDQLVDEMKEDYGLDKNMLEEPVEKEDNNNSNGNLMDLITDNGRKKNNRKKNGKRK